MILATVLLSLLPLIDKPTDQKPEGVLLVLLDDVAYHDMLEVPSYLDTLRAQGVSFTNAHAQPTCAPMRASIFLGRYADNLESPCLPFSTRSITRSERTVADFAQYGGFTTAHFGKWHLGANRYGPNEETPLEHGYDFVRAGIYSNPLNCGSNGYDDWYRMDDGFGAQTLEYQTDAITNAFLAWQDEITDGEPWFGWVAYGSAHAPFHDPPGFGPSSSSRERYENMLIDVAAEIELLICSVDLSKTVVIVMGDNGTPPNAVPDPLLRSRVKTTTYDRGIRVPLIILGKGLPKGETRDEIVSHVDIGETIARLTSTRGFINGDGENIFPYARYGITAPRQYVYCRLRNPQKLHQKFDEAIVTRTHKLRTVRDQATNALLKEEFYDRIADPDELSPLPLNGQTYAQLDNWLSVSRSNVR